MNYLIVPRVNKLEMNSLGIGLRNDCKPVGSGRFGSDDHFDEDDEEENISNCLILNVQEAKIDQDMPLKLVNHSL